MYFPYVAQVSVVAHRPLVFFFWVLLLLPLICPFYHKVYSHVEQSLLVNNNVIEIKTDKKKKRYIIYNCSTSIEIAYQTGDM